MRQMLLLLLYHQGQHESDAVADIDSSPSPSVEMRASGTQVMMGKKGRVCCDECVADTDCGAELDALCYGERANGGGGAWAAVSCRPCAAACGGIQCHCSSGAAVEGLLAHPFLSRHEAAPPPRRVPEPCSPPPHVGVQRRCCGVAGITRGAR